MSRAAPPVRPWVWELTAQPGDIRITELLRLEKTPKIIDSSH